MVSQDQRSFMDVDVTGLLTPEALMQRIRGTLGHAETLPPHSMQAQTYRRQYGRVQLGEKLDAKGIFAVVSKNADSEGSLRLLVSTGDA
ncbi:hypothetical protein CERZMDRAFT_89614 [Cercospora zeae-maydis SCOH1-5]|uniref:Uncharacterized protein n=1 Tax=Cercospora zeae-maydis SCOH1-5 TaxID=717836 RepID=A0A6A6FWF0_9PEZI|nr:hypothetical protein CERZMDRAFT_89614 [Cercospora zeae-maydis SCOH1-5]